MNWDSVQIGKACLPTRIRDPREAPEVSFHYVDISSIDRDFKTITSTSEVMGKDAPSRARKEIQAGNIIISTVRPNLNSVAIVPPDLDGHIASTGFCVLHPNSQIINGKYLFYFTLTTGFIGILSSKVRGAHYPAVSDRDVKEIEIPLPPLSEQRRIVEILDQADALRKKRAEADAKAARTLPALFYKMFGDPLALSLSQNAVPLGQLDVGFQNGFACGEKDVVDGIPHLRMNNIDDSGVLNLDLIRTVPRDRDEKKYRLQSGDVLFMGTNSEDKVGKTCVFYPPDDRIYLFSNHLIRIRINDERITPEFLSTFLHLLWAKKFYPSIAKRWVNQASVPQDALARICIQVPLHTTLIKFAEAFKNLLTFRTNRCESSARLNTTFQSLLHRAFTSDLTAKWREAHMKELLAEMEVQTRVLDARSEL